MADRPTSAFSLSLVGGIITLGATLIVIHTWFAMYSANGVNFGYSQWYVVGSLNLTAMQGLALLIMGAACGISIIVGAVLQYSGERSKVRWGSMLVLVATIMGIPSTSFGWILGGLLSTLGAAVGLGWKPAQSLAT